MRASKAIRLFGVPRYSPRSAQTVVSREPRCSRPAPPGDPPRDDAVYSAHFHCVTWGAATKAHSRALQKREAPSTRWARRRNGHVCAAITPQSAGHLRVAGKRQTRRRPRLEKRSGCATPGGRSPLPGRRMVRRFPWTRARPECPPSRYHSRDAAERGQVCPKCGHEPRKLHPIEITRRALIDSGHAQTARRDGRTRTREGDSAAHPGRGGVSARAAHPAKFDGPSDSRETSQTIVGRC